MESGPNPITRISGYTGELESVLQHEDSTRYSFDTGIGVDVRPVL
jgi:hypothetical protein